MSAQDRRLVLVVGTGRSGTSLFSGILGQVGFHIPQPEVQADESNPRGFGEPRWVVDFHTKLLRRRRVGVNDARPAAFEATRAAAEDPEAVAELRTWLSDQLDQADLIVVKDPRTGWFLPLWLQAAAELSTPTSFVTMLRHPAEIIASAMRSYGPNLTGSTRAGGYVNHMLETEGSTRGDRRAFVRYDALLRDWSAQMRRVGEVLEIPLLAEATPERHPQADAFVDPSLYRARQDWDGLDVPDRLRELTEDVWERLLPLAEPGGDAAPAHARLDEAHAAYRALYAEAEALAQSSIIAVRPRRKPPAPGPVPLRVRLARRVPARHRNRMRRALRRLGGSD